MKQTRQEVTKVSYKPLNFCDYSKCEHKCCNGFDCGDKSYCTTKAYVVATFLIVFCVAIIVFAVYVIIRIIRGRLPTPTVNTSSNSSSSSNPNLKSDTSINAEAPHVSPYVEHEPTACVTIDNFFPLVQVNKPDRSTQCLAPPFNEAVKSQHGTAPDSLVSSHIGLQKTQGHTGSISLELIQQPGLIPALSANDACGKEQVPIVPG